LAERQNKLKSRKNLVQSSIEISTQAMAEPLLKLNSKDFPSFEQDSAALKIKNANLKGQIA
jgi:hypothetical protein